MFYKMYLFFSLETLISVLSLTEDFVSELYDLCQVIKVDQPEYKTLSNKKPYRIKCYALGQIAYGEFSRLILQPHIIIMILPVFKY